jgi:hypothetical protein
VDRRRSRDGVSVERRHGDAVTMTLPRLQLFWLLIGAILFVVAWNAYQTLR